MRLRSSLILIVLLVCLIHESDGWWGRRRRRGWRAVSDAFKRVGKAIVRVGKVIVKYVKKGIEILKHGCCGLHPSYCTNKKEYDRLRSQISTTSAVMNRDWAYVKAKLANIKQGNINNQIIYREVRRITLVSELNTQTLDPEVIGKLNNISHELKVAVRRKNQTVMDFDIKQIDDEFGRAEDESKRQAEDAKDINGINENGYREMNDGMLSLVRTSKTADFLETDAGQNIPKAKLHKGKVFGVGYIEKLDKSDVASTSTMRKLPGWGIAQGIATVVQGIILGFQKFIGWITDLATCNKKRKDLEANLRKIRTEHAKITANAAKLKSARVDVDTNWNKVLEEAVDEGLLQSLDQARKIAEGSSSSSSKMNTIANSIRTYRSHVVGASNSYVVQLQNNLIKNLGDITYNAECYQRKMATYKNVANGCKAGLGSFDQLYQRALEDFDTNDDKCKDESGLPYTSEADVRAFLTKKATKEKFEEDCLLNSAIKKNVICEDYNDGIPESEIIAKSSLSQDIVLEFLKTCPIPEFSPIEEETVCLLKPLKSETEIRTLFPAIDREIITEVYTACPAA